MKHYKSVEILSIFRVPSPPRRNAKPPYWKLSGDGSEPWLGDKGAIHPPLAS